MEYAPNVFLCLPYSTPVVKVLDDVYKVAEADV